MPLFKTEKNEKAVKANAFYKGSYITVVYAFKTIQSFLHTISEIFGLVYTRTLQKINLQ